MPFSTRIFRSYLAASSSAGPSSERLWTFDMPTLDPRLAGFTNKGYFIIRSMSEIVLFGEALKDSDVNQTYGVTGIFTCSQSCFVTTLSIPTLDPSTPAPTYGIP